MSARKHHSLLGMLLLVLVVVAGGIAFWWLSQAPAPRPHPLPPITEYEDNRPAPLPSPTKVIVPVVVSPSLPAPSPTPVVTPAPVKPVAASKPKVAGKGLFVVVIDDMGVDVPATEQAMRELPPEVTFAFLPYGARSIRQAEESRAAGHDILVHIPMEPMAVSANGNTPPDPGPHTLRVGDDDATLTTNLNANLTPFLGIAQGANNHMGSRFTQWPDGMRLVLQHLQDDGMFFLDSVTTAHTATKAAAAGLTLPLLRRDVFLDDTPTEDEVSTEFDRALTKARQNGYVVVIGHPHPATLAVLARRLPELADHGLTLAPITALLPAHE